MMDLNAFITRWQHSSGSERANYQLFVTDLCELLDVPKPGSEAEIIRTMKESFCECAPIGDKQATAPPVRVTMPDGEELLLGDERFQATEVLFSSSNGMTKKGIQGLAYELLGSVDRDIAARLQTNVHIFGGTSQLLGFTERFGHELKIFQPTLALERTTIGQRLGWSRQRFKAARHVPAK